MNKLLLCVVSITLVACVDESSTVNQKELDERLSSLQGRVDALEADLREVNSDIRFERLRQNLDRSVFLRVGESEFLPIRTYIGTITFNLEDIQPFANGSKVTIVVGNPLNATLAGAKFQVDYGSLDSAGEIEDGSEKTKEIKVISNIQAGSWNKVPVILDGLETSKLGYIRVHDFEASQIRLITR